MQVDHPEATQMQKFSADHIAIGVVAKLPQSSGYHGPVTRPRGQVALKASRYFVAMTEYSRREM